MRWVGAVGQRDHVVASAGYAIFDNLVDGDPRGWRDMVLTNVLAPANLIRASLQALKQMRVRIVLIGSAAGVIYTPGNIYGATKSAVTGYGAGVTLVNLGATATNFFDADGGLPDREMVTADDLASSFGWAIHLPAALKLVS